MKKVTFKKGSRAQGSRPKGMPSVSKDKLYKAIRDQCIDCMGGEDTENLVQEIQGCTAPECPLYPYRPYQLGK